MINFLKTMLHILPIFLLCSVMAACSPHVSPTSKLLGNYSVQAPAVGTGSMLD